MTISYDIQKIEKIFENIDIDEIMYKELESLEEVADTTSSNLSYSIRKESINNKKFLKNKILLYIGTNYYE